MEFKAGPPDRHKPIIKAVQDSGLDPQLYYEAVVELTDEGLLTAVCINAAATILLTELGLPRYFFRNISRAALKRILYFIGTNLRHADGRYILRSEVAQVEFDIEGDVQVRIATADTRDRMESILNTVMAGRRVEYYFGKDHHYYTYIVRPETAKELSELAEGESPFTFAQTTGEPRIPQETEHRYEAFLQRLQSSVTPLVIASPAKATNETRVMFRDDFSNSPLPVVRQILASKGIVLNRAYWQTYRGPTNRVESVCSVYLDGTPTRSKLDDALDGLRACLALGNNPLDTLFLNGQLRLEEFLFAANAHMFAHTFIYKYVASYREIMDVLTRQDLRDAMAKRVFDSNCAEYTRAALFDTIGRHPELLRDLFAVFDRKFNPRFKTRPTARWIRSKLAAFQRKVEIVFIDDTTGHDIFSFLSRIVTHVHKTNF